MILLISDLHKTLKSADEAGSVKWLLGLLEAVRPKVLVSAGDWGRP